MIDGGTYSCVAQNRLGKGRVFKKILNFRKISLSVMILKTSKDTVTCEVTVRDPEEKNKSLGRTDAIAVN